MELKTVFHAQIDGQPKRSIQIFVDMLRSCVIDFGGQRDHFLSLVDFPKIASSSTFRWRHPRLYTVCDVFLLFVGLGLVRLGCCFG